jgi:hypothetical protein
MATSGALSLFPARVRFTNADGTLTAEGYRALQIVYQRLGGAMGDEGVDVFQQFTPPDFGQGGYGPEVWQVAGLPAESLPEVFQVRDYTYDLSLKEDKANKDATGGYVGLTGFSINFKNAANTFTSLLANTNTAARTYTFPDKSMTVAGLDDITGGTVSADFEHVDSDTGYSTNGVAGASGTFDPATVTAITVDGGLITGWA